MLISRQRRRGWGRLLEFGVGMVGSAARAMNAVHHHGQVVQAVHQVFVRMTVTHALFFFNFISDPQNLRIAQKEGQFFKY